MNIHKAVKAMEAGYKVRRPTFNKDNYLYLKDHTIMSKLTGLRAYFVDSHFHAEDWEIVKEKESLSDKCINFGCPRYEEIDVKSALREFIHSLQGECDFEDVKNRRFILSKEKMLFLAKRCFGERLIK